MNTFFARNIQYEGRLLRGLAALALGVAAVAIVPFSRRLSLLFLAAGLFTLFEAMQGWCVLRACEVRTRL